MSELIVRPSPLEYHNPRPAGWEVHIWGKTVTKVWLTCWKQGRIVWKPVYTSPELKVNQTIAFSSLQIFFFFAALFCVYGQTIYRKPHCKVTKLKSKFYLSPNSWPFKTTTYKVLFKRQHIIKVSSGVCRSWYLLCACCLDIGLKIDQLSHSNLHGVFLMEKTVLFLKLNYKIWWHFC